MDSSQESRHIWRKSSYSSAEGQNCVEVAITPAGVAVRDSKNPAGPVLTFGGRAWRKFLAEVKR
ncbi:DUF397 domain-containing protein [Thermopolyspora sp. NPDC052614]|uniref:DUF397 domain-containing protein n=1 Tax=Thermopolyspora sp. NPDC052614 TaxID=3155682 RepID=UPI003439CC0A